MAVPSQSGVRTAGYLTIRNEGSVPDHLDSVESEAAREVELHETLLEGDVMRMRRVESVSVPAGGAVELAPAGLHLMLLDLTRSLEAGQVVELLLRFRRGGDVTVQAVVRTGLEG
jgi:copper(I)-binding protein